jgi:hypothetical protein
MQDGLLRAVAQIYFGEQTERAVEEASAWLKRRMHFTTGFLLEQLAERIQPSVIVERSASLMTQPAILKRAFNLFPHGRFIHLVQHPRGYGEELMKGIAKIAERGPVPYWMLHLASFPEPNANSSGKSNNGAGLDPQRAWYALHTNVCDLLKKLPEEQHLLVRVEDLLANPRQALERVIGWAGLRLDNEAIENMQHPERSLYACFGPPNARYGNESFFLNNPTLEATRPEKYSLDGALSWRPKTEEFLPKVKELACQFGYQ